MTVKNELKRMSNGMVMTYSKILSWLLSGWTEENYTKRPAMIVCVLAEIQIGHPLNTSKKCYYLIQLAWLYRMVSMLHHMQ
jgi:hypothetical protein